MCKYDIRPGMRIGYWTVLDINRITQKGERKWLCRCKCGTERYVLERSLRYGGSYSCGCFRKERIRNTSGLDLAGQVFGELTVLQKADDQRAGNGVRWLCRCSCGNTYECLATLLTTGKRTHCGCKTNRGRPVDLSGRRFHRLTAQYMLKDRDAKGSMMWHCVCDCGNEVDVSYNNLVYSNMKSCGCQKEEHNQLLGSFLMHIEGTSLDMIKSRKLPSDNTTGYKGVYRVKGKYLAKIVFQHKQYHLGTYTDKETAVEVRHKAEKMLFEEVVNYYERYRHFSESNPDWAEKNPIRIQVKKKGSELSLVIHPVL